MLAMLEHMGSRKIMVSQTVKPQRMSEDILKHLAEEARHASFFKRQAERAAGHDMEGWMDDNTMARVPALMYFGRLDAGISNVVGPSSAYSWVSLIIELRACWLYRIYQQTLAESDYHLSLKSLLAEENRHLEEMYIACGKNVDQLKHLSTYESGLFKKLWDKIITSIEQPYEPAVKI
ncbi:hypothetical Protein YC6258_05281 [Gynuella sunshinyii YC6258]|uniref:Rubrerythrin diiron-binding domain-containing protein n=2 Tax=Gynuella sunshinyii TaxID=1445505 RepID=A0A0C5VT00_9GAMM|nr:hypothetical Protein YC6258_05281 [Gynuella sunshinyii YC6258]